MDHVFFSKEWTGVEVMHFTPQLNVARKEAKRTQWLLTMMRTLFSELYSGAAREMLHTENRVHYRL